MAFPATFVDMQNNVVDKARIDADFDTGRIKDWLNSAYFTAIIETGFYQTTQAAAALINGQTAMAVPAGIHKIEYVSPTDQGGQVWGPMRSAQFEEILRLRAWQGAQVSTGAPSRYAIRVSGAPTVEFWPMANGGEVLTFYGWGLPAPMVNPTDVPIIPEPYTKVIEYGALIHASEYQKDLLMIQQFEQDYADWKARFLGYKNKMGTSQPDQFVVEFGRPWPSRNDVDQGY